MRIIALLIALSLVAVACGDDTSERNAGGATTSISPSTTAGADTSLPISTETVATTAKPATTSEESTSTTAAATTTVPDVPVTLSGGGFGEYEIGVATRAETVAFVESFLGPPARVRHLVEDEYITCPSGADTVVSWQDQLLLVFFADVLSGYLWEGDSIPLATPEGIIINNTVADLQQVYPGLEVVETSLGFEWFLDDGLHGFVESPDAGASITAIGGQDMCAFR